MMPLKLAFITTIPTDTLPCIAAIKTLNAEGEVVKALLRTGGDFRDFGSLTEFIQYAKTSHLTIIHLMGDLPEFDTLLSALKAAGVPFLVASSLLGKNKDLMNLSTVEAEDYGKIVGYLNYGGKKNFQNLLLYLTNRFTGASYDVLPAEQPPWEGIYHPDFDYLPTLEEYTKRFQPDKLTVGIWFHHSFWQGENLSFMDSLIEEVERQGANVLPVFFSGAKDEALGIRGLEWVIDNYFLKDEQPIVDVVVSAISFSLSTSLSS